MQKQTLLYNFAQLDWVRFANFVVSINFTFISSAALKLTIIDIEFITNKEEISVEQHYDISFQKAQDLNIKNLHFEHITHLFRQSDNKVTLLFIHLCFFIRFFDSISTDSLVHFTEPIYDFQSNVSFIPFRRSMNNLQHNINFSAVIDSLSRLLVSYQSLLMTLNDNTTMQNNMQHANRMKQKREEISWIVII